MKGKEFEDMACIWLLEKGYMILKRNHRCKRGEIDIIAKKEDKFIAFEVKGNISSKFGLPQERIDTRKIERVKQCFLEYAISNNIDLESLQIDAILVYKNSIMHLENILCQ